MRWAILYGLGAVVVALGIQFALAGIGWLLFASP